MLRRRDPGPRRLSKRDGRLDETSESDPPFLAAPPASRFPFSGLIPKPTRRSFVVLLGSLFFRPSLLFAQSGNRSARGPEILRAVCDHMIPASERGPGALELGLDAKLLSVFEQSEQGRLALQRLAVSLGGRDFLRLPRKLQSARLQSELESGELSRQLDLILSFCAQRYYSDPRAWSSIGYRTPQPGGYPDYASGCGADESEGEHGRKG